MEKIWSSDGGYKDLFNMSPEEKRNYLDLDPEIEVPDDKLDDVISNDEDFWYDDAKELYFRDIKPMIEKQTRDGILILVGKNGRWDGDRSVAQVTTPENLLDSVGGVEDIELFINDEGNICISGQHHDGTNSFCLYTFSEDPEEFLKQAEELGMKDEYLKWYPEDEEHVDDILLDMYNPEEVEEYIINWDRVPEVCNPIKDSASVNEEVELDEVKANEDQAKGLKKELKQIKPLLDEYGYEYFTSMPFSNYDNDPISFEYNYPQMARIVKQFFKEMGLIEKEDIDNNDVIDDEWDYDFGKHDFDTCIKVAEIISNKPGKNKQFEKVFKDGQSDGLDDDEILANREKEIDHDEFGDGLDDIDDSDFNPEDEEEIDLENESLKNNKLASEDSKKLDEEVEDEEDLDAETVALYAHDYDGTPESLEAIRKDLVDHYVYDESDEAWVNEIVDRIKNAKNEALNEVWPEKGLHGLMPKDIANEIVDYARKNNVFVDLEDYDEGPMNSAVCKFNVSGDWKHEHLFFEKLVEDYCKEHNLVVFKHDNEQVGESDDDSYEAIHTFYIIEKENEDQFNDMRKWWNGEEDLEEAKKKKAKVNYTLTEEDEVIGDEEIIEEPVEEPLVNEEPVEEVNEDQDVFDSANAVMAAYQNANKWLDSVKEFVYSNLSCVFFSSLIHELAHTMPGRFDKFGDILHTIDMKIPYPATQEIPSEPQNIDEVFDMIFDVLDNIKIALNDFIKITDDKYHGMACSAEALLNDIEEEYPMLFRLQKEWQNANGDMVAFDKYVGQYNEHKDDLLESLDNELVEEEDEDFFPPNWPGGSNYNN